MDVSRRNFVRHQSVMDRWGHAVRQACVQIPGSPQSYPGDRYSLLSLSFLICVSIIYIVHHAALP